MKRGLLAAVALTFLISGCNDEPDWSKYAPDVKARIDAEAAAGNCAALQGEFDAADHNNHTDLMKYVDGVMSDAGCYG